MDLNFKSRNWIFIFCFLCQMISTILALIEMFKSEHDPKNAEEAYRGGFILFDVVAWFRYAWHLKKYTGAIALFVGCFFIRRQSLQERFTSVTDIWMPAACFITAQLLGVIALTVRLVLLFWYTLHHICNTDLTPSLEPNHIMLGIASAFGLISIFLYIGDMIYYLYNTGVKYEEDRKRQEKQQIFNNVYDIKIITDAKFHVV